MSKLNRELSESEKRQIPELQKLSFDFYYRLALGGEPLTYSYREPDAPKEQETQVEVNAKINKKNARHLKKRFCIYILFKSRYMPAAQRIIKKTIAIPKTYG